MIPGNSSGAGPQIGLGEPVPEAFQLGARAFPGDGIRVSIGEPESVDVLLRVLGELVGPSQEGPST